MQKDTQLNELENIQNSVIGINFELCKKGRKFIMRGPLDRVMKRTLLKAYHVYLFDDLLLYTEVVKKKQVSHKYVEHKFLKDCIFIDCEDKAKQFMFEILHITDKKRFTFMAKSLDDKNAWKQSIEMQANIANNNGEDDPDALWFTPSNRGTTITTPPSSSSSVSSTSITSLSPTTTTTISANYEYYGSPNSPHPDLSYSHNTRAAIESERESDSVISSVGSQSLLMTDSPIESSISSMTVGTNSNDDSESDWTTEVSEEEEFDSVDEPPPPETSTEVVIGSGEDGTKIVKAATIRAITWILVYGDHSDTSLILSFLFAYRKFSSPSELFDNLFQIYHGHISKPKELTLQYSVSNTKRRVTEFLKIWIENFFFRDFRHKNIYHSVLEFLRVVSPTEANAIKLTILRVNKKRLENRAASRMNGMKTSGGLTMSTKLGHVKNPSTSRTLGSMEPKFSEMSCSQIAEQLTLVEHQCFQQISLSEFAKMAWKSKEAKKCAPNILDSIARFNMVGQWVSTEIVTAGSLKQRALAIERFIQLAQRFVELKNYNALMEMLAGLNRGSVQRLKKTWSAVASSAVENFQELNSIMDPKHNFKNYRDIIKRSLNGAPCLPYIGMYLRDITFIEDGNDDKVGDLVNYEKIQMLAKLYKEVLYLQKGRYPFVEDDLQNYFKKLLTTPEELLYKHSQTIEPSTPPTGPDQ